VKTLADHFTTFDALHALAAEYPLLPAADMRTESNAPGDLLVSCWHLDDFELWREALHADPAGIEFEVTAHGRLHLVAEARFAGATVILHGYSPRASQPKVEAA
jgi:hypothetical protein